MQRSPWISLTLALVVSACTGSGSDDGVATIDGDSDGTSNDTSASTSTATTATTSTATTESTGTADSGSDGSTDSDGGSDSSSTGDPPSGLETDHGGLSLAEWMKMFWTWELGGDQEGRYMDRMFLDLPESTDPDGDGVMSGEIDIDLAAADGFVLPWFVWYGETYDDGTPPDDKGYPPMESFTGMSVVLTLDGENIFDSSVDDLSMFYWDAIDFDMPVVYDMPTDYHSIQADWVKGIGSLHAPLSVGDHELHLEELNEDLGVGFSNTWHLHVQ